jgi:hypothetical protein
LQSATSVEGPYGDVPGTPEGTYIVPAGLPQYFRVRAN